MEKEYEYIVVGSGAGGGPVAANLARAGRKVLLLEAGGAPDNYLYQVPAFHATASEEPGMSWHFFVRHYADPAQQRQDTKAVERDGGPRVFYPRAGTLGGCTAHNAMIFAYPFNSDWDEIAELTGDRSWRAKAMRRYFVRLELCRYRTIQAFLQWLFRSNPSRHGFAGWLGSDEADPELLLGDDEMLKLVKRTALFNLLREGRWLQRILRFVTTLGDPNDWRSVKRRADGLRLTPLSTFRGARNGSRERVLEAQKEFPENLTVRLGALATRVLFEDEGKGSNRAVGVEYLEGAHLYRADPLHGNGDGGGTLRQARASREVILAGGAFNTPQLLQLSGIGPADLLAEHGIPVRVDLPGVGANLQDRYEISVVQRMKKPFSMLEGALVRPPRPGDPPDPHWDEWLDERTGIYTINGAVLSILKRSTPEQHDPDLFLFGLVSDFHGYYPGYSQGVREKVSRYFTWGILKGRTHYSGRVAIRSRDPREPPDVDFHYFPAGDPGTEADLDAMVHGVRFVRSLGASYRHLVAEEAVPGPGVETPEQLRAFIRNEAWGHHASCTCKIGRSGDPMAVVDSRFRVRGTEGLRVVDASVFPRIPGLFVVSAVYMIAEKASDDILADAEDRA